MTHIYVHGSEWVDIVVIYCRGVHLKDLILLNTALPDMFDGSLVNFRKMVQLSFIFTEVMQVQGGTLPFEVNMDLANTLRVRRFYNPSLLFNDNLIINGNK